MHIPQQWLFGQQLTPWSYMRSCYQGGFFAFFTQMPKTTIGRRHLVFFFTHLKMEGVLNMAALLKTNLIFLQIVLAMKKNNDYETRQLQAEHEKKTKKKTNFFSDMKMILIKKKNEGR